MCVCVCVCELSEPRRNEATTEKSQSWFRFSSDCYYQTREFTPATVNPHKVRDRCRCPVCLVRTQSSGRGFSSFLIYTVLIRYQWSRRLKIRSRAGGILSLSLSFFSSPVPLHSLFWESQWMRSCSCKVDVGVKHLQPFLLYFYSASMFYREIMIHIQCSQALVQTFTCLQKPDIWEDTQSDATLMRVQ